MLREKKLSLLAKISNFDEKPDIAADAEEYLLGLKYTNPEQYLRNPVVQRELEKEEFQRARMVDQVLKSQRLHDLQRRNYDFAKQRDIQSTLIDQGRFNAVHGIRDVTEKVKNFVASSHAEFIKPKDSILMYEAPNVVSVDSTI